MAHRVQNAPCQAWMPDGPPHTTHDKGAGKSKIHDQPDYTTHGQPVDERNYKNPVPGIVLPCFFDEGEYCCYRQAGVAQRIDKIKNARIPFSVCIRFQYALLSTLLLVQQVDI